MIVSGLGMGLCTLVAGLYLYYTQSIDAGGLAEHIENDYILLVCILGYVSFSAIGFLVIPWALIGELLPTEVIRFSSEKSSKAKIKNDLILG